MRIKNTSRYPDGEVAALVHFGTRGVNLARVQVNVKNSSHAYRGMAYSAVPIESPFYADPRVRRLITVGIGAPSSFPANNLREVRKWFDSKEEALAYLAQAPTFVDPTGKAHPPSIREHGVARDGYSLQIQVKWAVVTWQPYGGKRSPFIEYRSWQEALVTVAAHEARHIFQFQHQKSCSEVDCERFAAKALEAFRKDEQTNG